MNHRFYQRVFTDLFEETTGTISEIQSGEMDRFIAARFNGVKYDYHHKLTVVQQLTGSKSGHFLDFGCGWGYIAFQAQDMGWTVGGFEINPEFTIFVSEKLGINVHTAPEFINTPENYGHYDVIFMHHVLEHLMEPRQTLDALYQLLKPGGHLIIVVPNAASDRWNNSAAQTLGQNHISAFTKTWFQHNLPGHGFIVRHTVSAPYVFDDTKEGFAETMGTRGFEIMAVAQRLPKDS
jgi:2-polyprenyl-3-methyl-5-hydroxy-6-metoxy-1,4-benzoquinol methylase